MRMLIKPRLIAAIGLLLIGSFATAAPSVSDNTISWPDDGWYQVQDQATHTEVCGGGRSCDVEPGTYVVINHSTGERFNNITVVGDDEHTVGMAATAPEPVRATIALMADKTFRISWPLSTAAQFYRVFENPDGISGFTDVSAELDATTTSFDHQVALFARVNAQYFVQSCNDQGCVDSEPVMVTGTLHNAIGYFKASNTSPEDLFGRSISLNADGNTMAIGAMFEDGAATGVNGNQNDRAAGTSGAVFVFVRINGAWQQQAYIKASDTDSDDYFGGAVNLSTDGKTIAVGAYQESSASIGVNGDQTDNTFVRAGAVYLY